MALFWVISHGMTLIPHDVELVGVQNRYLGFVNCRKFRRVENFPHFIFPKKKILEVLKIE